MDKIFKIGLLKETKVPIDRRVPLTPRHSVEMLEKYPEFDLVAQKSDIRCFSDSEYIEAGIPVKDDVSDCDLLAGVKEVAVDTLIPEKTYLFFSHTGKKQPHNRRLLQEIVRNKITLIDYEYLTDRNDMRLVAFGRFAGIVGAYNGLLGYGIRTGRYELKRAYKCHDLKEMMGELHKVSLPPVKILITGGGRVAKGALETLAPLNLRMVKPGEFLNETFDEPVICQAEPWHYVKRKDGDEFDLQHFFYYPEEYESTFKPYVKVTDLFIPCHYWDPRSPVFLREEDYRDPGFRISVIADISCDICEPIASTIRASTIEEPFYGYNPETGGEGDPFDQKNVTVMAVDNLPGELPRDASEEFSEKLIESILPAIIDDRDGIIERATIVNKGMLTQRFGYLQDYLEGKE